ncbi:MAG: GxxExxY protein [Acidobacteria bacterium]|nr:GxxExxY protein [Acidobacteriota bacterium]
MTEAALNELTEKIIGAAIAVHRELGPGLLESAYERCLAYELHERALGFEIQKPLPLVYKGVHLDCGFRMDVVVENAVVVEIKSIDRITRVHVAQMLSYLKLSGHRVGLLINFNVPRLLDGVRRLVNQL